MGELLHPTANEIEFLKRCHRCSIELLRQLSQNVSSDVQSFRGGMSQLEPSAATLLPGGSRRGRHSSLPRTSPLPVLTLDLCASLRQKLFHCAQTSKHPHALLDKGFHSRSFRRLLLQNKATSFLIDN